MSAGLDRLAAYFTGPCVGLHSMGLSMNGAPRVAADQFYQARAALGVEGYVSADEAKAAIIRTLGLSDDS